jgi:hypothetical protein
MSERTSGLPNGRPPTYGLSKLATEPNLPGDEVVGDYSRDRLLKMNERFVERMERAIARGKEKAASKGGP